MIEWRRDYYGKLMSMGIPFVAHHNNFLRAFDQTDWSSAEDFLDDPELIIPRGDFVRFKQVISRLISDDDYRHEAGERCRVEHVKHGNPESGVRHCEAIYSDLVNRHLARPGGRDIARG